jgi:hypothetical protein
MAVEPPRELRPRREPPRVRELRELEVQRADGRVSLPKPLRAHVSATTARTRQQRRYPTAYIMTPVMVARARRTQGNVNKASLVVPPKRGHGRHTTRQRHTPPSL